MVDVRELEGSELDAAVARAEGRLLGIEEWKWGEFAPSSNWEHGGPIIERERIVVAPQSPTLWVAFKAHEFAIGGGERGDFGIVSEIVVTFGGVSAAMSGATPLIAAMRSYVASKGA